MRRPSGRRTVRRWPAAALVALLLSGCGAAAGGGAVSTATTAPDAAAVQAATQLETTVLPGTGSREPYRGRVLDPPVAAPSFELTATDGSTFSFADDATAPVTLVYFGYTSCPDVCPTHMASISQALERLPDAQAGDVQVLFVSVDPEVDTPERLGEYLGHFDDRIVGLTGTPDEVNAALVSVGLEPTAIDAAAAEEPRHPSSVLAYVDGAAHLAYPFGTTAETYRNDLDVLTDQGWTL